MKQENTKTLLLEIINLMKHHSIIVWIGGGWAEELHGVIRPRIHKDIDLLYPATGFEDVDLFIKHQNFEEISEKHLHHKRAFIYKGVLVELFLVEMSQNRQYTNFWNKYKYYWPKNVLSENGELQIVSKKALRLFRHNYSSIQSQKTN